MLVGSDWLKKIGKHWGKGEGEDTGRRAKTQINSGAWEKREEEKLSEGEAWRSEGLQKNTIWAI